MPKKSKKDRKQDQRISDLEEFVYKTIENKQVHYSINATNMSSTGYRTSNFIRLNVGAQDGSDFGDPARIGNTITLMNQKWGLNFQGSSTDTYNQIRVLIVESKAGNVELELSDVLQYSSYVTHGDNVFSSPYTTKNNTNRRYKVHMDKCFVLSGLATKGGAPPAKVIKHNIKFGRNGKTLEFDGPTSSNPSNFRMNLFVITDSVSATHPSMSYNVRSTYKDA